jgi:hypothetical protein
LSGNGYDATSYTDTYPVLTAGALNGRAAYLFPGAGFISYFVAPTFIGTAEFAAFVVFRCLNTTLYGAPLDADYVNHYSMEYSSYGSYGAEYWVGNTDYLNHGIVDNSLHCMALMRDSSGNMMSYLDGALLNTQTTTHASGPAVVRGVGCFHSYGGGQGFNGYVGEVLEYPFALSGPQLSSVNSYLAAKWGY